MLTCTFAGCNGQLLEDGQGGLECIECHMVLKNQSNLTGEQQYNTTQGGTPQKQGFDVSLTGDSGFSKTKKRGKELIEALRDKLRIDSEYVIKQAERYFNLTVTEKFTRGRSIEAVAAACTYLACRCSNNVHYRQYMLLDFAEEIDVDVFKLGKVFMSIRKLRSMPELSLSQVDPVVFVTPLAEKIGMTDQRVKKGVKDTAVQLICRFKKDWLQVGRHPKGLCCAALFIALRMHGMRLSQKVIAKKLKVSDATLRKRLKEFLRTPSSQLTTEQFEAQARHEFEDTEECDPPAYYKHLLAAPDNDKPMTMKEIEEEVTNFFGNLTPEQLQEISAGVSQRRKRAREARMAGNSMGPAQKRARTQEEDEADSGSGAIDSGTGGTLIAAETRADVTSGKETGTGTEAEASGTPVPGTEAYRQFIASQFAPNLGVPGEEGENGEEEEGDGEEGDGEEEEEGDFEEDEEEEGEYDDEEEEEEEDDDEDLEFDEFDEELDRFIIGDQNTLAARKARWEANNPNYEEKQKVKEQRQQKRPNPQSGPRQRQSVGQRLQRQHRSSGIDFDKLDVLVNGLTGT